MILPTSAPRSMGRHCSGRGSSLVTTGWYKKMGEKIWTPWFIKFVHSRGYYNIYTNFLNERALSISHRDAGVNYGRSVGPDSILLDTSSLDFNLWEMQPLKNLKWYDFCFREVHPGRIARTVDELGSVLDSLKEQSTIILVSLFRIPQNIAKNLLCHFERRNIKNYILIGINSEFLLDLARIGHAVVDADQLIDSLRRYDSIHFQISELELDKEILIKAYIVKKSLECGYNTWVVEGDMIPIDDAFDEPIGSSHDFFASTAAELLYAKSSPASLKTWNDDIIYDLAVAARSLATSGGATVVDHKGFVSFALNALGKRSAGRTLSHDTPEFAVELGVIPVNRTFLERGKKMVFLAPGLSTDAFRGALENVGMWIIDGDSSCTAVLCHQS
uniref:Ornithine carbamoyltransferase n=1 Tax=Anthurium amnicola TaxID=1678845 RepID=A0A1D1ZKY7_9ARAE